MEQNNYIKEEDIVKALQTLKDLCDSMGEGIDGCEKCPVGTDSAFCRLEGNIPTSWNISEPQEEIWRALL